MYAKGAFPSEAPPNPKPVTRRAVLRHVFAVFRPVRPRIPPFRGQNKAKYARVGPENGRNCAGSVRKGPHPVPDAGFRCGFPPAAPGGCAQKPVAFRSGRLPFPPKYRLFPGFSVDSAFFPAASPGCGSATPSPGWLGVPRSARRPGLLGVPRAANPNPFAPFRRVPPGGSQALKRLFRGPSRPPA